MNTLPAARIKLHPGVFVLYDQFPEIKGESSIFLAGKE